MKRTYLTILVLCSFASVCLAGGRVNTFTLKNGLTVIHKETRANPLVTMQFFLRGGTLNETPEQAGLTPFTQSVMLQGTARYTSEELARAIEDIGGNISADAEYDYCSMGISLMDMNFEQGLDIIADIVKNPSFPASEIDKERKNLLAALKSRKDQIFYVANDLFNETFYGSHPYGRPDLGGETSVKKITRDDLVKWHRERFTAQNMLLVVAGNVDLKRARKAAESYCTDIPEGKPTASFPSPGRPEPTKITRKTAKFQQAYLMIGYPAPAMTDRDFPALKIVNALLGSRMTGRLFTELREKLSLAYEVSSFYPSRRELSKFVVYMGLDDANTPRARARIFEIIEELKKKPVDAQELEDTKNFVRGIFLLDHQTISRQAWNMGWWTVMGYGPSHDDEYLQSLMSVTAADITRVANAYFSGDPVEIELKPAH